jgi:hypothetical protein
MPNPLKTLIRLPIQIVPPRGAIESPKTVTIRDPARSVGRERNSSTSNLVIALIDIE